MIGIGGVYNYGCEAIIRGTENAIRREYPDAHLVYASRRVSDDQERLKGSDIEVIERRKIHQFSVNNLSRKALSLAGISWNPRMDSLELLRNIDIGLSIGGDLYTLRSNGSYNMSFPKFGDAARRQGVPFVLWGASVGPFSSNPGAERAFARHLKGLSLISARESLTVEYLATLGVSENVIACADPAFLVAPEMKAKDEDHAEKLTIGINLSPLAIRYSGLPETDAIHKQARVIEGLVRAFSARIVLIPHVVCDFDENDDDLRYLRKVMQSISSDSREDVVLVGSDPGFIGIKKELLKCDILIAARMHCAINALAAHVPTIFVSYSRKAEAMCEYVYGNRAWVIRLSDFIDKGRVENVVRTMIAQRDEVREQTNKRNGNKRSA